MGARAWHIARAKHHKEVADYLSGPHVDWAAVALFYSALHWVHSSLADEPGLAKDERHPRKHTAPAGSGNGGRGVNQLVRDLYPSVHPAYISLFDISRRTRYDVDKLGAGAWTLLNLQLNTIRGHCEALNASRPAQSPQAP